MWSKTYQLRRDFVYENRIRVPLGRNGAMVWGGVCADCGKQFKEAQLQIDHIVPNHTLTELEHIGPYCDTNFCEKDNMQFACKYCHDHKTYAERNGMTFKEAVAAKKAIKFAKKPIPQQVKMLEAWGVLDDRITNNKKRRAAANLHYLNETK
jgi:5-methylcytosine-specific restriction endonuclease McrA